MTQPWQSMQVESTSGSGSFIRRRGVSAAPESPRTGEPGLPYWGCREVEEAILESEGDLVLTAAHVIADARDVRVQLLTDTATPEKFVARVRAVANDSDLALLEVLDERCFASVEPMRLFGPEDLLEVQSKVQVMGFPIGGDYLSVTEGVLSRVEVVEYSHSRRPALALTVDAAINAGNSGGPVVDPVSGRVLGVAHQKVIAQGVENQGQCVPPCLIWRFLWGQAHDRLLSQGSMGVMLQHLESPAHREQLGLAPEETGILIREVHRRPGDEASSMQEGDVVLKVGDYMVDNFGTVRLFGHRVALSAVQDLQYMGDQVCLTVRRNGEVMQLFQTLGEAKHLVPRSLYGEGIVALPGFLIFGGLVFVPLSADFLEQAWPRAEDRPPHLVDLFLRGTTSTEKREALVLLSICADDVNAGHGSGYVGAPLVKSVGGTDVVDLAHLAKTCGKALREDEFVRIEVVMSTGPYSIVLRSSEIAEANERIMQLYNLPCSASPGISWD